MKTSPHAVALRARTVLVAVAISAASLVLLGGCSSRQPGDVVVIEKTKSYHTDECPKVNMANTRIMTVAEAKTLNCLPCKACNPDQRF